MLRAITLLLFCSLMLNVQAFCDQAINTTSTDLDYSRSSNYNYNKNADYDYNNFDENSFNISDEQFKEVEEVEEDNEKQSFTSKVINSSHFSPNTATRTWIPFRKKFN